MFSERRSLSWETLNSSVSAFMKTGRLVPEPPASERMLVMLRHIDALCAERGMRIGMREARKHAAWYIRGIHGAAAFRSRIGALSSLEELYALARDVIRAAQ